MSCLEQTVWRTDPVGEGRWWYMRIVGRKTLWKYLVSKYEPLTKELTTCSLRWSLETKWCF